MEYVELLLLQKVTGILNIRAPVARPDGDRFSVPPYFLKEISEASAQPLFFGGGKFCRKDVFVILHEGINGRDLKNVVAKTDLVIKFEVFQTFEKGLKVGRPFDEGALALVCT